MRKITGHEGVPTGSVAGTGVITKVGSAVAGVPSTCGVSPEG
jgi:hypothetical protein